MIKIASNDSISFSITNEIKINFLKSSEYRVTNDNDKISISNFNNINLLTPVDFSELRDKADQAFGSAQLALDYILRIINNSTITSSVRLVDVVNNDVFNPGLGTSNMNVDGSSTPVIFEYEAVEDTVINRINLFLENNTTFLTTGFAALAALANGLEIKVEGLPFELWKTNRDIAKAADIFFTDFLANINKTMIAHKETNFLLRKGQKFEVIVNDDLTGIDFFTIEVEGRQINI